MKTNKEVRMEKLQAAGVNTDKFFNINLSNIPAGSPVKITIGGVEYDLVPSDVSQEVVQGLGVAALSNGGTVSSQITDNCCSNSIPREVLDSIGSQIIEDGYVRNTKLHRRWVMAQTFKMLNSSTYNHKTNNYETGWDAYVRNNLGYMYQFDMTKEELKVLSVLQQRDGESFIERSNFFTKSIVVELCLHHLRQLRKFVGNQKTRKCKGQPYVKLSRYGNVFVKDLENKVYIPLAAAITAIKASRNYSELYISFANFISLMSKLPHSTPLCPLWKDAYKGSGAYYTLKNMIMFHGVTFEERDRDESMMDLDDLLEDYRGQYWRFHMLLKKLIVDTKFDFVKSIELHK